MCFEGATKEGGSEAAVETSGDEAMVEPLVGGHMTSSVVKPREEPPTQVAAALEGLVEPVKKAMEVGASEPAIPEELAAMLGSTEGILEQFCSAFRGAGYLARSSCQVGDL